MKNEKAVVVFSGGQDSTTCLFWALSKFKEVTTVTFDYGQRHAKELEYSGRCATRLEAGRDVIIGSGPRIAEAATSARPAGPRFGF